MINVAKTAMMITFFAVCNSSVKANITMETVPVGNVGNPGELSGSPSETRVWGSVNHHFRMGKFEVTAGQYTEFLNAVAATDSYGLYHPSMADPSYWVLGCNIQRTGSPGSYMYSVASDWANRPVNYITWADVARFANWMHNGQPTGDQDTYTTELGSYNLTATQQYYGPDAPTHPNGKPILDELNAELFNVTREPDATWVIPSVDEWYKAAYHKNDGVTGNYFDFPTCADGDNLPQNDVTDPDPGNNLNYYGNGVSGYSVGWSIGSPYYRTEVGEFENSASAYGTFDQGGNVREWTESTLFYSPTFFLPGGSFGEFAGAYAGARYGADPATEEATFGFRLAYVPEPTTFVLIVLGGLVILRK